MKEISPDMVKNWSSTRLVCKALQKMIRRQLPDRDNSKNKIFGLREPHNGYINKPQYGHQF